MQRWRLQAACIGADPELFYASEATAKRKARSICQGCDVIRECFAAVMANEKAVNPGEAPLTNLKNRHGIHAGTTAHQRWSLVYPEAAAEMRVKGTRKRQRNRSREVG